MEERHELQETRFGQHAKDQELLKEMCSEKFSYDNSMKKLG